MVTAIILAAGRGTRMGQPVNKVYLRIAEKSVLLRTLEAFERSGAVDEIVIVCREEERARALEQAQSALSIPYTTAEGGSERQYSVLSGIRAASPDADILLVHDAARCFVKPQTIRDCVASARKYGSGVAGVMVKDTLKRVENGKILGTVDRSCIARVQTPQAFSREILIKAHEQAAREGFLGTDEAVLAERMGVDVKLVAADDGNIKVTTREDLKFGEFLTREGESEMKIGHGYDAHALTEGRKLILGGVHIPYEKGLCGHSDADVLTHAVMDALLGAAGMEDIGCMFPPTDPSFKDACSITLLKRVGARLRGEGFRILNVDATVILQAPRLRDYIVRMRENIAGALQIPVEEVGVKATTTEAMGFEGKGEGAGAHAVCLLKKSDPLP